MTLLAPPPVPVSADLVRPRAGWLPVAAAASLGAGAVHAAAAGAHGEHRQAVLVFAALALTQLGWGALALARPSRVLAAVGFVLGGAAVAGWVAARVAGLPVDGLEAVEPVQRADLAAAVLALVALSTSALAVGGLPRLGVPVGAASVALALVAAGGTVATASHEHAGTETAAHPHGGTVLSTRAVPYDPALPIDLSGTPGVTPAQQAAAENLVAVTVSRLPRWADADVAIAAGFRSIGDGFGGTEHLVNQAFHEDDVVLDPDRPESLVYDTTGGGRRLVAAMYMLKAGTPLSDVPDVGGGLVQWHTHEDLCYTPEGLVRGITDAEGDCRPGLVKPVPSPMVHVWITPHRCGPFAALEGIAGGRIPDGEARLCDHAHGKAS